MKTRSTQPTPKPTKPKLPTLPRGRIWMTDANMRSICSSAVKRHFKSELFASHDIYCAVLPCHYRKSAAALVKAVNKIGVERATEILSQPWHKLTDEGRRKQLEDLFPTSWLDPIMTGPNAALYGNGGTWGCPDIERLISAIRNDVVARLLKQEGRV